MKKHTTRLFALITLGFGIVSLTLSGCSGPIPLSEVIQPEQEKAYRLALKENNNVPKAAYLAWKSQETGQSVEELKQLDTNLIKTKNPFNARKDIKAVGRGAMLYKVHCASCHGEKVDGHGPLMTEPSDKMDFHSFGKRFAVTLHHGAPKAWFRKIHDGYKNKKANADGSFNVMPSFGKKMTREQIWLTITYLQSLEAYNGK